jgi:hypothetical protein
MARIQGDRRRNWGGEKKALLFQASRMRKEEQM